MASTYTQIHIQTVFAVGYRAATIQREWKDELYKYITGIIQEYDHRLLIINGMADHVHALFGMRPTQSISDLLQKVKSYSSKWINDRRFVKGRFEWQEGFGAFSYSKSQLPAIIKYIENQESHHQKQSFLDEYRALLNEFGLEYDERYLFQPLECFAVAASALKHTIEGFFCRLPARSRFGEGRLRRKDAKLRKAIVTLNGLRFLAASIQKCAAWPFTVLLSVDDRFTPKRHYIYPNASVTLFIN